ncbi:MAG: acyl-CoA dehydrogenase family protein, partial [Acidimicrobiia bacterium]|nr:acyl-CoA dehydrogenase family protein [Acidimicrobiia bacterium]
MDLTPSPAEAALRAECREWLHANLPWGYGRGLPPRFDDLDSEVAFGRQWQARLAEGRWVGVAWPEVYGGRDAGPIGHYIVTEELARARAPELVGRIGVNLVGP